MNAALPLSALAALASLAPAALAAPAGVPQEVQDTARAMWELASAVDALARSEGSQAEKAAALEALVPQAARLGKEVRRLGSKRVESAARRLYTEEELLSSFTAINTMEQDAALRPLVRRLEQLLRGRPDPDQPAPPEEVVEEFLSGAAECAALLPSCTLQGRELREQMQGMMERLAYPLVCCKQMPDYAPRLMKAFADDPRVRPAVEALDFLPAMARREDGELGRVATECGFIAGVTVKALIPSADPVAQAAEACLAFMEDINAAIARNGDYGATHAALARLLPRARELGRQSRAAGREGEVKKAMRRAMEGVDASLRFPALRWKEMDPVLVTTAEDLMRVSQGRLDVASCPKDSAEARRVARTHLDLLQELEQALAAARTQDERLAALRAVQPRAAERGQALPPTHMPRVERALTLLCEEGFIRFPAREAARQDPACAPLLAELERLLRAERHPLEAGAPAEALAAELLGTLQESLRFISRPNISRQEHIDELEVMGKRLLRFRRWAQESGRAAELAALLKGSPELGEALAQRPMLRKWEEQGGLDGIAASDYLAQLHAVLNAIGLE